MEITFFFCGFFGRWSGKLRVNAISILASLVGENFRNIFKCNCSLWFAVYDGSFSTAITNNINFIHVNKISTAHYRLGAVVCAAFGNQSLIMFTRRHFWIIETYNRASLLTQARKLISFFGNIAQRRFTRDLLYTIRWIDVEIEAYRNHINSTQLISQILRCVNFASLCLLPAPNLKIEN